MPKERRREGGTFILETGFDTFIKDGKKGKLHQEYTRFGSKGGARGDDLKKKNR